MNIPKGGAARAVITAMVRAEGVSNSTKVFMDTLLDEGFVIVPRIATQEMLDAWTRQHTPGEVPTLQQRYQRAIRKRPK